MNGNTFAQKIDVTAVSQSFMAKVYGWMCVALATTGLVSAYIVASPQILSAVIGSQGFFLGIIIAQLALVVVLSAALARLSAVVATGIFFLYSALTGVTLSVIFAAFTAESLATTFFVTAGTFGAMCVYGVATKRDLTSIGNLCFMGLIGLIIASVVNLFFKNSFINTITSYVGVLVFVGLTAFDAQKIKQMGGVLQSGSDIEHKAAIMGALRLYLDFINLFLLLMRFFGRRR